MKIRRWKGRNRKKRPFPISFLIHTTFERTYGVLREHLPNFAQVKFTVTHDSVARTSLVHDIRSLHFTVNRHNRSKTTSKIAEI